MKNKNVKPKIFRLFHESVIEEALPEYDFVIPPIQNEIERYFKFLDYNFESKKFTEDELKFLLDNITNTILQNLDITGVFVGDDLEAFIIVAIFNDLKIPNITVPSLSSFYQLLNKVYHKQLEENPIKYSYFDIFDENWEQNILPFPFFLKPAMLQASTHTYVVNDIDELRKIVDVLRMDLPKIGSIYKLISERYLDLEKFPLAIKNIMLCEEWKQNCDSVNWDGFADSEGKIVPLIASDQIIVDGIVAGYKMPSKFPPEIIEKMNQMCSDICQKSNYTTGALNAEFFIDDTGDIRFIETNPRNSYLFFIQHKQFDINQLELSIKLSRGESIQIPKINIEHKFAIQYHLVTRQNGKIGDIFNLKKFEEEIINKNYKTVFEHFFSEDIEHNMQHNGRTLAIVFFETKTMDEAEQKTIRLRRAILPLDYY
jgi:hypothetical protein